jgi:hypothetical protein
VKSKASARTTFDFSALESTPALKTKRALRFDLLAMVAVNQFLDY